MIEIIPDFETVSACDLTKAGAWRYAEDPTTDVVCCSITIRGVEKFLYIPNDPVTTERVKALAANPDTIWVAHNAGFEKAIWRKIMVPLFGFPDIPNGRWHDTMAVCAMRRLPLKLARVATVLDLPMLKDEEGSKITLGMSKLGKNGYYDRSPAKLKRSYEYCMQDGATQLALLDAVGYLPPGERDVWLLDQRINERGVKLDTDFIHKAQQVVMGATAPLLTRFGKITDGLRPTQVQKVLSWVQDNGYWLPDLKKETLADVLGSEEAKEVEHERSINELPPLPSMPDNVAEAMRIRSLTSGAAVKKLARMEACVCEDGRARGLLQYHAAGPGRWGGRLFQPQNFPRGSLVDIPPQQAVDAIMTGDHEYVRMLLGDPMAAVASSLRHALIASPGRTFEAGDFASIEARVVLALAGQHDKTALLSSGADVYIDMALDIFNMPRFDVSDKALTKRFKIEHLEERQTGKNTILGCGFQMGWETFWRRYCSDQPHEFAQKAITTYRTVWAPEVPKVWAGLEEAALETVLTGQPHSAFGCEFKINGRWLTILLPSGRLLWYFNPRAARKTMPWSTPEKPDVRMAWTFQTLKMGRWVTVDAYGGIITENIVQALARDLLAYAMFIAERNGMPIVLTTHDEILAEPLTRDAGKHTLQQIMEDSPMWAKALKVPVQVEDWHGDRYRK